MIFQLTGVAVYNDLISSRQTVGWFYFALIRWWQKRPGVPAQRTRRGGRAGVQVRQLRIAFSIIGRDRPTATTQHDRHSGRNLPIASGSAPLTADDVRATARLPLGNMELVRIAQFGTGQYPRERVRFSISP